MRTWRAGRRNCDSAATKPAISASENRTLAASLQYKRAFFVDWRVCDRWKRPLIAQWDFVLDTNDPNEPKLAEGRGSPAGSATRRRGGRFGSCPSSIPRPGAGSG